MAHKKAGGSTALGRESQSQRLGIKITQGDVAKAGSIIVRQRGTKFRVGQNTGRGSDDTIYAKATGLVTFTRKKIKRFNGALKMATFVNVMPKT